MNKGNLPAFPSENEKIIRLQGLTKREYFARGSSYGRPLASCFAEQRQRAALADALIAALNAGDSDGR